MTSHLKVSPVPLEFKGEDMEAVCGKNIPQAKLAFIWGETQMGKLDLNSLLVCGNCILRFSDYFGESYLYGIVRGDKKSGGKNHGETKESESL